MKVDKLCIINFGGTDTEAKACSLGLLVKYAISKGMMANAGAFSYCAENKATLNAWVSNKGDLKEPSNYQEYKETTKDLSQEAKAYFTTKKKSDPLDVLYRTKYFSMAKSQLLENGVIKKMKGNSDLSLVPADNMALDFQSATQNGLYLVGHGNTAADAKFNGTWEPKRLAAFLYLLGLARVTKLVLVACGLGTTQVSGQSYLTKFCTALADHDIYPKVAGWDQFVSVATPGNPVSTHINVSGNNIGTKIASPFTSMGQAPYVSQEYRTDHKKMFQWVQTKGVVALQSSQWSDKTQ